MGRVAVLATLLAAACSGSNKGGTTTTTTTSGSGSATTGEGSATSAGSGSATTNLTPGVPVQNATLAEVGLEATSIDKTADPCVDFYQFACGGWLASNQIPGDQARWARFSEIEERNKTSIRNILEEDAKGIGSDPIAKKLGNYYASCMDTAGIEKAGLAPIKPLLEKAKGVKDAKSWQLAVAELHKAAVDVVWGIGSGVDFHDSLKAITQLDSGGLGLPDRDYYSEAGLKDKLEAYRAHVARMLELGGTPKDKSAAAAADVIAIETELANVTKTASQKRDIPDQDHPTDAAGLAKQVKSVDWKAYWKALDFTPSAKINIGSPKFFAAIDGLRTKFKPAQWASYFTYHVLITYSFTLPKAFDDEAFTLKKALTGQPQQAERYKRCIDDLEGALGELLGQQYTAKFFPPTSKQTAITLVDAIVAAMGDNINTLDWMSADTKKTAQEKRDKIVRMIGFPDKWRSYDFDVKRDDFGGNELRATIFETHRQLAKSGKPTDRGEWHMNAFEVNAYYDPTQNNTALPAGILQTPFFGPDRGVAANLGGIGMVIGHELTHGFDDQGAQFDKDGNLSKWWKDEDYKKFEGKGKCVADQYSTFEVLPKQFVKGELTLGEDIADMGGVKLAFHAYKKVRSGADKQIVADGFTEDQQFFLAVGQAWCSKDRPEEAQRRLTVDPHAPPKFRVYGALRNLPEFSKAFSCAQGTPMHPTTTCQVW
jgi:putative endopeptidase